MHGTSRWYKEPPNDPESVAARTARLESQRASSRAFAAAAKFASKIKPSGPKSTPVPELDLEALQANSKEKVAMRLKAPIRASG